MDYFTFKYEPQKFEDMILNDETRKKLQKVLNESLNVSLVGPPGVGKGTFTNIFLKTKKYDFIKINCSAETSIETIRGKVQQFATSLGSTEYKIVVLNEFDFMSTSAQAMLRDLIEEVNGMTRFIIQCNYKHKVIPEIFSRCPEIIMGNPPVKDILKKCIEIIKDNNIKLTNKNNLTDIVKNCYPDIRKTINTIQLNVSNGILNGSKMMGNENYEMILDHIKKGDMNGIRTVIRNNMIDYTDLYNYLFENVGQFEKVGDAIITIGEYLYRDTQIAIKEINFLAMVSLMVKEKIV